MHGFLCIHMLVRSTLRVPSKREMVAVVVVVWLTFPETSAAMRHPSYDPIKGFLRLLNVLRRRK